VGALDPTEKTSGKGVKLLKERGVEVEVGLCRDEAVRQNAAFYKQATLGRPLVLAKWAMTLDGKIATRTGSSRWISSEASRRVVHELRGRVDCVVVGAGTVRADDPDLTCRLSAPRRQASRLVVCGSGDIPSDCKLVRTAREVPVIIAHPEGNAPCNAAELEQNGCQLLAIETAGEGRIALDRLMDRLGSMDMTHVLVEGGGSLLGGLFDADLVDRAMAFVAPRVVGGGHAVTPVAGRGVETMEAARVLHNWDWRRVGDDLLMEGWLSDPLNWVR
jgi:diaminohydroxyphosphoribosylaminopyrimidine deaminase/5-amino-6-(5-phosphoribosylamino)uracil reductase